MTDCNQLDATVDDLLIRWHGWRDSYRAGRGYGSGAMFKDAVSAWSSYDRDNGVSEEIVERQVMEAVDRAIDAVPNTPHPWHTAIMIEARNLACGASVWSSARLPRSVQELEVLRIEARNRLVKELERQGCLGA